MSITNVQVTNFGVNLLSVPTGIRYAVTAIMICNTATPDPLDENAGMAELDMYFIPSGIPYSEVNLVLNKLQLRAGETFSFDTEKIILDAGDKVFLVGSPEVIYSPTQAGDFEVGRRYTITTPGDTDFISIGAVDNNVGTSFTATGAGSGTGSATLTGYTSIAATASYLEL